MMLAARWIGQFHARAEKLLSSASFPFLVSHTAGYYIEWARQTSLFASDSRKCFPWLAPLCQGFEELIPVLLTGPATVIHGEYYPENILVRGSNIYPVDWQSAAIAAGEIDLAVLTNGEWDSELVQRCEQEYQRARWPYGVPNDFKQKLALARLYWSMIFLGDAPESFTQLARRGFIEELRSTGEQLRLI